MTTDQDMFLQQSSEFIRWLVTALNQFDGFSHEWKARSGNSKSGLPKRTRWSCTSLFSAYQQYIWPARIDKKHNREEVWQGRLFPETERCLCELKTTLEKAIAGNDPRRCRSACIEILEWGGVDNRKDVAADIKRDIPDGDLVGHLQDTTTYLNACLNNNQKIPVGKFRDRNGRDLRMDSGTTKIYSLLCDRFVMYDGRVASALGYLVRRWWKGRMREGGNGISYGDVPECLRFSYDGNNKNRNPNPVNKDGKRCKIFEKLKPGAKRTRENVQASWLLSEVLRIDEKRNGDCSNFAFISDFPTRLRSLEAAFFMIGYDVSSGVDDIVQEQSRSDRTVTSLEISVHRKERRNGQSKMDCCRAIYKELEGSPSSEIKQAVMKRCNCTENQASTYYYKVKKEG